MEFNKTKQLLSNIGNDVKEQYKFELKNNTRKYGNGINSYASGQLFNSVDFNLVINDDNTFSLYFIADDYYIDIENGRRPNQKQPKISMTKIKKWMIDRSIKGGNRATYLISKSIEKNGIKAKPYLRDIKKELNNINIITKIEKTVIEDYKQFINNKIKEINKK